MKRNDILDEAKKIINGEREGQYGSPEDSFNRITLLWSGYLGKCISKADVANMMILMKIARNMNGTFKADNWVDICGYAALGAEIQGTFTNATHKEEK